MARTIVAITGASSGIGATFARKLAPEHDLILIARRKQRLEALRQELASAHQSNAEIMVADLTSQPDLDAVAERIHNEQRLVLLVNNAGFGTKGRFWEASLESEESMHRLHIMATMRLSYAALRNFVPRDVGAIINVASVAAFIRRAGSASYSATKSWMADFTEGLGVELKSTGSNVAVQALCPGYTESEFHDKWGMRREQMGARAWWLTSEQVVDASLDGLRKRKLFVIPGWRYRVLVAFLTKLPSGARVALERKISSRGRTQLTSADSVPERIGSGH